MKMYKHQRTPEWHVSELDGRICHSEFSPYEMLYPRSMLAFVAGSAVAQDLWASPLDLDGVDFERLGRALDMLPPFEADVFELIGKGCRQLDIAHIFGCTQANISYRLSNAVTALKFILSLPDITEEGIRRDLSPHLNAKRVDTLAVHFRTSNYSHTAQRLGMKMNNSVSSLIKWRIVRSLDTLRDIPEAKPYVEFFQAMIDNPMAWSNTTPPQPTTEKRLAREAQRNRELAASFALTSDRQGV